MDRQNHIFRHTLSQAPKNTYILTDDEPGRVLETLIYRPDDLLQAENYLEQKMEGIRNELEFLKSVRKFVFEELRNAVLFLDPQYSVPARDVINYLLNNVYDVPPGKFGRRRIEFEPSHEAGIDVNSSYSIRPRTADEHANMFKMITRCVIDYLEIQDDWRRLPKFRSLLDELYR